MPFTLMAALQPGATRSRAPRPPGLPHALSAAACAVVLVATIAACQDAPEPPALAESPPAIADLRALSAVPAAERSLGGGEVHRYSVDLAAGEVVRVVAEQRGVDLALAVVDPHGDELIRADRPIGTTGAERLTLLAAVPGRHLLEVRESGWGEPGRYLLRVVDGPRPAGPVDRLRAEAERTFYAARARERQATTRSAWEEAAVGYREALRLWSEADDRHGRAIAGARLGGLLFELEEFERAEAELAAALPLLVAEGELDRAAVVHNTLGALARGAGRLDEAAEHYDRAAALAVPSGNHAALYRAIENRGMLDLYRGDLEGALESLAAAREGWHELGRPREEAGALLRIGVAYREAGEADLAAALLTESHALAGGHHRLEVEAASALAELATVAFLRGELDRCEELLGTVEPVFAAKELRGEQARALNQRGQCRRLSGCFVGAREDFTRAAELFRDPRDVAMAQMHLAWTFEGQGEAERALALYRSLLAEFRRLGEPDLVASVHYGWARAALAAGRLDEALDHIGEAIAQVERRRQGLGERTLGAAYGARKSDYYRVEVETLMSLHEREPDAGWAERALAASERGRARQLVASLLAGRGGRPPLVDPSLAAERDRLYRRIRGLELALSDGGERGDEGSLVLVHQLRLLRAEAERLEARIAAADPRFATLAEPPSFDLDRFRAQLDPGTVVLVLGLGERRSWLWRIAPDRFDSHALAGSEVLDAAAADAHRLLALSGERRAAGELARVLQRLSDLLLAPVVDSLEARRLVLVADGALHYVPLAALPAPAGGGGEPGGRPGRPLLDRLEVVGLPSLAVLDELRRRERERPPPAGLVAVVADPVTAAADDRLPAAARRELAAGGPGMPDDLAALASDLGLAEFPRLPWAASEADAILALAPPDRRWQVRSFAAHRETVLAAPLGRYRFLHFAVHVVPDERHPQLSGLVLSRFTADGRPRDGLLRLADVFRLDLPVELVVLSGCRSGRGKELRGDGIVGLTRAFMAAGAPRVVVSLWDVNDRATHELMVAFYEGLLRRGLRPPAALRAAQQRVRAEPGWQAPYYWAGFVLQGDWR